MGDEAERSAAHMTVKWRSVAVGSLLVNLAAIAAVATLSVSQQAEALSTVALSLAVIAFVCQLIVFAIQTAQSSEQLKQAQQLNASTESLLAEARTRLEGTHQMVTSQYQELMHLAALKGGSEIAVQSNGVVDAEAMARLVESVAATPIPQRQTTITERKRRGGWTLTIDEARSHLEVLEKLDDGGIFAMNLAAHLRQERGIGDGMLPLTNSDKAGLDAGLVEEAPLDEDGSRRVRLSPKGVRAGQLLAAPWPPPEELAPIREGIWKVREQLSRAVRNILDEGE